jgi:hypothetical protein
MCVTFAVTVIAIAERKRGLVNNDETQELRIPATPLSGISTTMSADRGFAKGCARHASPLHLDKLAGNVQFWLRSSHQAAAENGLSAAFFAPGRAFVQFVLIFTVKNL